MTARRSSVRMGGRRGRIAAGRAVSSSAVKRLGVAVVRRGREEEAVLEVRREAPDGLGPLRVGRRTGRRAGGCDVVDLVDDQQVERAAGRRSGRAAAPRRAAASARSRFSQSIDTISRGKWRPDGLAPTPAFAPQLAQQLGVDDPELEPELLAHLVAATCTHRLGRADDQDRAGAVPQQELLDDEARLDRLAQPDVVGDQQVDARHASARTTGSSW